MKWDEAAEKAQEMLAIPPIMAPYARLQSEKIARHKKLDRVTAERGEGNSESVPGLYGQGKERRAYGVS